MGEQATKIGRKLEGYGEKLFEGFGWGELTRDKEIKCKRSTHAKRTHGLDLVMKFSNPYISGMQGVVVECKNRQMKSITKGELDKWLTELINGIECAQSSDELGDLDLVNTNLCTGLLLVHANDEFDEKKFNSYLGDLIVKSRRNPINIFIAGNKEINRWNSLLDKIGKSFGDNLEFVYPSIEGSNKEIGKHITINQLYSKYIFAQHVKYIKQKNPNNYEYEVPKLQTIVFTFDENTIESFGYLWSMFKFYQFAGSEKYIFVFYPRNKDDAQFIKDNFIKTLYLIEKPIDKTIEEKIEITFMDNREISPVDVGRT